MKPVSEMTDAELSEELARFTHELRVGNMLVFPHVKELLQEIERRDPEGTSCQKEAGCVLQRGHEGACSPTVAR